MRAKVAQSIKRPDDVTELLRQAVRVDPQNVDVRLQLAQNLVAAGKYEEATGQYSSMSRSEQRRSGFVPRHLGAG